MLNLSIWRDIPGLEGFRVNKKGEIASCLRKGKFNILPVYVTSYGLYFLLLNVPKQKQRTAYVDEIVAVTFLDNPYNFKYVAHKDGNKSNNHVDNLMWYPYPVVLKGQWKKIPGYSKYVISENGEVR